MPSGSLPRTRLTSRAAPWLLATLTLALALAGPANADSFGAEELQEAEAMLAAEVPEVPMGPRWYPSRLSSPLRNRPASPSRRLSHRRRRRPPRKRS
jgi:hypothetical protein